MPFLYSRLYNVNIGTLDNRDPVPCQEVVDSKVHCDTSENTMCSLEDPGGRDGLLVGERRHYGYFTKGRQPEKRQEEIKMQGTAEIEAGYVLWPLGLQAINVTPGQRTAGELYLPSIRELHDGLKESLKEGYVVRNMSVDETRSNVFVDLCVERRMGGIVKGVGNGGKRYDGPSVDDQ
ncbi:hypothetical protein F5141DRAFT_1066868 [Pisolithus sp. B1]|nr:hypothetical protein F5141DRAFT_1066868 [Pisolithus sp. B1]